MLLLRAFRPLLPRGSFVIVPMSLPPPHFTFLPPFVFLALLTLFSGGRSSTLAIRRLSSTRPPSRRRRRRATCCTPRGPPLPSILFSGSFCYASEMKAAFMPYVETTTAVIVPLLNYFYHDGVRMSCMSAVPHLINAVKLARKAQNQVSELMRGLSTWGAHSCLGRRAREGAFRLPLSEADACRARRGGPRGYRGRPRVHP